MATVRGLYIAAASKTNPTWPVVLFRELGQSSIVEVHRSSYPGSGDSTNGFCGIHGSVDGSYMVAVGDGIYKSNNFYRGILSWYDGTWHDYAVPATHRFCDVRVIDGTVWVSGWRTDVLHTGKIWSWTPGGGFVEVLSTYFPTSLVVGYHHFSDDRVSLIFPEQTIYNPFRQARLNNGVWEAVTDTWQAATFYPKGTVLLGSNSDYVAIADNYDIPLSNGSYWRVRMCFPGLHDWGNGIFDANGTGTSKIWDLTRDDNEIVWEGSLGPSSADLCTVAGAPDYCLAASYAQYANRIYKWDGVSLVSKKSGGQRYQRIAIAADNQTAFAITNNLGTQAYYRESLDAGETWPGETALTGYIWAAAAYFADGLSVIPGPPGGGGGGGGGDGGTGPDGQLVIGEDGGYWITVPGTFPAGDDLEVFIGPNGDDTDPPCYGGQGYGYNPVSADGTELLLVTPPVAAGIDRILSWRKVGGDLTQIGTLWVVDRNHANKLHSSRAGFPPWAGVGARRLEGE